MFMVPTIFELGLKRVMLTKHGRRLMRTVSRIRRCACGEDGCDTLIIRIRADTVRLCDGGDAVYA